MNITKRVVDTLTFTASTEKELDLPTDGLITRIDIESYLGANSSAESVGSVLGLWRSMQSLKIQGGTGKDYFSMSGHQMGMMLHYLNVKDFPGLTWKTIATHGSNQVYLSYRLHFGSRPHDIYGRDNPFDLTAAIPAFSEKSLKLMFLHPGGSTEVIDDALNIDTNVIRVTVHMVKDGMAAWSKMVPVSSTQSYDPLATKVDLNGTLDVPVGNYVRRIVVMCQDATTTNGFVLEDDQVTEVGLRLTRDNRRLIHRRTKSMNVCGSPMFDGALVIDGNNAVQPYACLGFFDLDMRQYANKDYGLDTRGMQTGDVELGFTIGSYSASGETEYVWFDQLQPWGG